MSAPVLHQDLAFQRVAQPAAGVAAQGFRQFDTATSLAHPWKIVGQGDGDITQSARAFWAENVRLRLRATRLSEEVGRLRREDLELRKQDSQLRVEDAQLRRAMLPALG